MIKTFRHKGLDAFFATGSARGIQPAHAPKLRMQLAALDTAIAVTDMDIPGYRLHRMKGNRKRHWSITVSGNWRITFEFENGDAFCVDSEDYH